MLLGAGAGALAGLIASASQKARLKYEAPGNQPDVAAVKRMVARLGAGERIIVTGVNTQETAGKIQAIGQDDFTMMPNGQTAPVQIAYTDVRAVKAAQSLGTKVGISVGVLGGIGMAVMCAAYCGGN